MQGNPCIFSFFLFCFRTVMFFRVESKIPHKFSYFSVFFRKLYATNPKTFSVENPLLFLLILRMSHLCLGKQRHQTVIMMMNHMTSGIQNHHCLVLRAA